MLARNASKLGVAVDVQFRVKDAEDEVSELDYRL